MDRIYRLLDVKLEAERARLEAICRQGLIEQAIEQVDSTIIQNALRDTSSMFKRPVQPDVPSLEIPELDSLGVKPLFGGE